MSFLPGGRQQVGTATIHPDVDDLREYFDIRVTELEVRLQRSSGAASSA